MNARNLKLSFLSIVAFVFGAATLFGPASGAFGQNTVDLSKWRESSSRKAGTRQTLTIGKTEIGLVWIPAGEFVMGSSKAEQAQAAAPGRTITNEDQIHVKLSRGFWMLETETTQGLYQEVMGANPSYYKGKFLPVDAVSWDEAAQFCEELSKRLPEGLTASLPTEAQWEYACRAGTKTFFSYGNTPDFRKMHARIGADPDKIYKSTPVKSYPPNPWGLYDMHGNVAEWVKDWYVETYSSEYGVGAAVDPEGPDDGEMRVLRGGDWNTGGNRSAARNPVYPSQRADYFKGFRFLITCD